MEKSLNEWISAALNKQQQQNLGRGRGEEADFLFPQYNIQNINFSAKQTNKCKKQTNKQTKPKKPNIQRNGKVWPTRPPPKRTETITEKALTLDLIYNILNQLS